MAERMLGLETEYALTVIGKDDKTVDSGTIIINLLEMLRNRFPHLDHVNQKGFFLANGALLYVDCGQHLEFATPECLNPWDVIRYQLAGERILQEVSKKLNAMYRSISEVTFSKCNVDYAHNSDATWGCHESYLHRGNPVEFPLQIIPHLVSRIIYTGAGGWNSLSPDLEFLISPRVVHLVTNVSKESTKDRGIFHTKNEPLCSGGYHRLHLLCGESLCSETASWLKMGTTALVVAMIEAGLRPGDAVVLRSPLDAINTFARDPYCTAVAETESGKKITAIDIQRHYLTLAETHIHDSFMPSWAESVCQKWRETLFNLENGAPESMERVLDWPSKLALFKNHTRRAGFEWDTLSPWNHVLSKIRQALDSISRPDEVVPIDADQILGDKSLIPFTIEQLTPFLQRNGLHWDHLKQFIRMHDEHFETDYRFGQLNSEGIFATLDSTGLLNHHIPGVDNIDKAIDYPPANGRAHLRGQAVRRFSDKAFNYLCDWSHIHDLKSDRMLDLLDPFGNEERWRTISTDDKRPREEIRMMFESARRLRTRARTRFVAAEE